MPKIIQEALPHILAAGQLALGAATLNPAFIASGAATEAGGLMAPGGPLASGGPGPIKLPSAPALTPSPTSAPAAPDVPSSGGLALSNMGASGGGGGAPDNAMLQQAIQQAMSQNMYGSF